MARRPLRLHPDFFVLPRGARAAAGLRAARGRATDVRLPLAAARAAGAAAASAAAADAAALKESAARFSKAVDAAEAEAAAAAPAEAPAEAPAVELAGLKTVGFSSDMAA